MGRMMKRHALLLVLCLGCGGDTAPSEEVFGLFECVERSRSDCSQPLPETDADGSRWPTYEEASRELTDCSRRAEYIGRRRGTCADGKTFVDYNGGFSGELFYFAGGTLVGVWHWSDVVICVDGSSCQGSGLGDPTCVESEVEEIVCPGL
jgi:hypothetical protein